MLRLVTEKAEIAACQRALERSLRKGFAKHVTRDIGYPSDTKQDARVQTDGLHWHHTSDHRGSRNKRRLNWFGMFAERGNLQITVEINIPFAGRNDQIAGFFAREHRTGAHFLVHSGRVGGGTVGIGKIGFLAWTDRKLAEFEDNNGDIREGIIVAPLNAPDTVERLVQYVDAIADYKRAVRDGQTRTQAFQRKKRRWTAYYEEARGRRKGTRRAEIDYITRHGDIVSAIHVWRMARPHRRDAVPVKDVLIDFGVAVEDVLTEVYEAKSSADRTSVYGAIGQLMVHGGSRNCRRTIVLPHGAPLASDVAEALARLGIGVLRFRFKRKGAVMV